VRGYPLSTPNPQAVAPLATVLNVSNASAPGGVADLAQRLLNGAAAPALAAAPLLATK
jgi:hypothetical protein